MGAGQVRVPEIGIRKIGFIEVDLAQVTAVEMGTAQVDAMQFQATEVLVVEIYPALAFIAPLFCPAVELFDLLVAEHLERFIIRHGVTPDDLEARVGSLKGPHCPL